MFAKAGAGASTPVRQFDRRRDRHDLPELSAFVHHSGPRERLQRQFQARQEDPPRRDTSENERRDSAHAARVVVREVPREAPVHLRRRDGRGGRRAELPRARPGRRRAAHFLLAAGAREGRGCSAATARSSSTRPAATSSSRFPACLRAGVIRRCCPSSRPTRASCRRTPTMFVAIQASSARAGRGACKAPLAHHGGRPEEARRPRARARRGSSRRCG